MSWWRNEQEIVRGRAPYNLVPRPPRAGRSAVELATWAFAHDSAAYVLLSTARRVGLTTISLAWAGHHIGKEESIPAATVSLAAEGAATHLQLSDRDRLCRPTRPDNATCRASSHRAYAWPSTGVSEISRRPAHVAAGRWQGRRYLAIVVP